MTAKSLRRSVVVICALVAASSLCGCNSMWRRMTIRSEPSGALVVLDGKEVGYTPYTSDFIYYGTRELTLNKDGYERLTVPIKLDTPWYQVPPADFVTDNLLPVKVTNRQEFCFALQPQQTNVSVQDLLNRAGSLRSE